MKTYVYELQGNLTVTATNFPITWENESLVILQSSEVHIIKNGVTHKVIDNHLYFSSDSIILNYCIEEKVTVEPTKSKVTTPITIVSVEKPELEATNYVLNDQRLPENNGNWSHIGNNFNEIFEFGQHKGRKFSEAEFLKSTSTDVAYYCGIKLLNNVYRKIHGLSYLSEAELIEIKARLEQKRIPIKLSPQYETGKFPLKEPVKAFSLF